ncbi:MAG TPA: alanine racemase [Planctomycetota bacterium]|nr:alanine racemase [Planctomycetota bacterium]
MQNRRVWAEIDLDALASNLNRVRALAGDGKGIMAVVKANAYGHGAVPIAWNLASQGVNALGVGDSEEAMELRRAGISIPILVLGTIIPGELADVVDHDIAVTVHSSERVRRLGREALRAGRPVAVHLKVDTGMGRLGCAPGIAVEIARLIRATEFLRFDGLCTHFASASDPTMTAIQVRRFEDVSRAIEAAGIPVPPRHAAASGAILERVAPHLEVVRPGIVLYGIPPSLPDTAPPDRLPPHGLEPVLTLKTQIIFLKDFEAGAPVGYEGTHVTRCRTRIATLPVGYNDGYPWSLSGRGEVLVRGHRAPVVGRISMDYLMVDVGRVPGVSVGDEVVLIGASGDQRVTVKELADRAGTIPYEILTRLGKRVVRTFRGGTVTAPEQGFTVLRRPGVWESPPTHR